MVSFVYDLCVCGLFIMLLVVAGVFFYHITKKFIRDVKELK